MRTYPVPCSKCGITIINDMEDRAHSVSCEFPKTCDYCGVDLPTNQIQIRHHMEGCLPSRSPKQSYIDYVHFVTRSDNDAIAIKDKEYGGSWKRRGGVGAYMMVARKIDRLEEQMKKAGYDIFKAIKEDTRQEGIIDDIRDLRRYLILIEAEMLATGTIK